MASARARAKNAATARTRAQRAGNKARRGRVQRAPLVTYRSHVRASNQVRKSAYRRLFPSCRLADGANSARKSCMLRHQRCVPQFVANYLRLHTSPQLIMLHFALINCRVATPPITHEAQQVVSLCNHAAQILIYFRLHNSSFPPIFFGARVPAASSHPHVDSHTHHLPPQPDYPIQSTSCVLHSPSLPHPTAHCRHCASTYRYIIYIPSFIRLMCLINLPNVLRRVQTQPPPASRSRCPALRSGLARSDPLLSVPLPSCTCANPPFHSCFTPPSTFRFSQILHPPSAQRVTCIPCRFF